MLKDTYKTFNWDVTYFATKPRCFWNKISNCKVLMDVVIVYEFREKLRDWRKNSEFNSEMIGTQFQIDKFFL